MRIPQKNLYKGMLVKLKREQWFDFIDTDVIGVVTSWNKKEVDVVFVNGSRGKYWIWNLLPVESYMVTGSV